MYLEFRETLDASERAVVTSLQHQAHAANVLLLAEPRRSNSNTRHFGLFGSSGEPVGYVRVVEAFESRRMLQSRPPLPFVKQFPRESRVRGSLHRWVRKHGMAIEIGAVLTTEMNRPRLTQHIAESLVAIYGVGLQVPCFLTCPAEHRRLYEHLGFRRIFRSETIDVSGFSGLEFICMYGARPRNASVLRRVHRLLHAYCKDGATTLRFENSDKVSPDFARSARSRSILQLALRDAA